MANKNHFNLTLDTTKPTGSIICDVRATNKVEELKISYNADAAYMKVWFDENDNSVMNVYIKSLKTLTNFLQCFIMCTQS